jgi:hypothetical protein
MGRLQDMHGPLHEVLQHTPCMQKPDTHSLPLRHRPVGGREQSPFMQGRPLTHCASLAQASKQAPVAGLQVNGTQMMVGPGRHWPAPSHTLEPTTASPSQVPARHRVPSK